MDELLVVLEDARLVGDAVAVKRLGAELAARLGVAAAGADDLGLWLRLEVAGADGESVGHRMRWCWPGRFEMGSLEREAGRFPWEGPQHTVVLTRGFWLGETAVTQALWLAVMGHNPSRFASHKRPVEQVSWEDCQAFCERLGTLVAGLFPRLPSEAQWEYAARAGSNKPRYGELDDIAWHDGNSAESFELEGHEKGTHPVAQKLANVWGLFDMLGNVWEWCQDATELAPYEPEEQRDPLCTQGSLRVIRGGSWHGHARYVRAACREALVPGLRSGILGFRLAGGAFRTRGGAQEG